MKLLFVHDEKFKIVDDALYSSGNLSNDVLSRYTKYTDEFSVFARKIRESEFKGNWSKITNTKVNIIGSKSLVNFGLIKEVANCDKMIVRLPSFLGIQALLINRIYKKPVLIEMVGCPWDSLRLYGNIGKIVAPVLYYLTKNEVYRAKYVVYVTEQFLQKRYPTKGKSIGCSDVALNGSDDKILLLRKEKIKKCNNIIIGTTAAIDVKYKGQENVIEALAILKKYGFYNFEYHLLGNGCSDYLNNKAIECGVVEQVKFLGGKPHDQVFDWLDSIDIYIQPSLTEGLPRALIEAQSRALPCIGANVGEIPKLLNKHCIYSINSNMPEKIANLLTKFNKRRMIGLAEENYNISKKYDKNLLDEKRDDFLCEFLT